MALCQFFNGFVEVGVEFLGAVEFLVFRSGFGIRVSTLHRTKVFENLVFIEGEKFVHALCEGFHGEGLATFDDALNVIEEGGVTERRAV